MSKRPLDGIRIVDFGWFLVAPITTKVLADCGAQVIKIETTKRVDILRTLGPFKDGVQGLNRSFLFNQWMTGKLGITLNLAKPRGIAVVKRLIARSDIVVENFAAGVMAKMGLAYEDLTKIKPDIIMLSTCMQGQTGPYSTHPGTGNTLTALAGLQHIAGWPDREPVSPAGNGPYTDYIAPHFCIPALVAALLYRSRTGKGQYLDVSQYETAVHFMAPLVLDNVVNHRVAGRTGNRTASAAPHNAYRCRGEDRWCVIAVSSDEEWQAFCKVVGNAAWTGDPKFSTLAGRKEHEDALDSLVEQWTMRHAPEEVMVMMQAAGVGAGVVQSAEDLLDHDPQLRHRRFFRRLHNGEVGEHRVHGPSFALSKSPWELAAAPVMGEHNEHVLKEIAGMSDEEIAELVVEGVIE